MLHVEPFLFLLVSSCPLSLVSRRDENPQEETAASLRSVREAASAEALPSRHK